MSRRILEIVENAATCERAVEGVVEHEVGPVACGGRRAPAQVESEVAHVPQHADDHLAGGVVGHDGARHAHDG